MQQVQLQEMTSRPTREALEGMKRADLQKLCKDYGLRANLKTEALIDLLLDTSKPRTDAPPAAPRSTSLRASSRNRGTSREQSTGSMIIHDEDEEADAELSPPEEPQSNPEPQPVVSRITRTRKAQETQLRLGVGRPAVAGGSGARAVTKASSLSKPRRGKTKGFQTMEAPILEEPEQQTEAPPLPVNSSEPGTSATVHNPSTLHVDSNGSVPNAPLSAPHAIPFDRISEYVSELVRPLEERLQSQVSHLERLTAQVGDVEDLKLKVQSLTSELQTLRIQTTATQTHLTNLQEHIDDTDAELRRLPSTPNPNNPGNLHRSFAHFSRAASSSSSETSVKVDAHTSGSSRKPMPLGLGHPGIAPSTLGKRHRDSSHSRAGVYEAGQEDEMSEDELTKRVPRPDKKRARLSLERTEERPSSADPDARPIAGPSSLSLDEPIQMQPPRPSRFTIFTGAEDDMPTDDYLNYPPTSHLPHAFGPDSPPRNPPTTSTANAAENQPPSNFDFSFGSTAFDPVTSTPYVGTFPFPEPPQSPTPVMPSGHSYGHRVDRGGRRERNDLFHPLGTPGRLRTRTDHDDFDAGIASGPFINPSALVGNAAPSQEEEEGRTTSNQVGLGLGMQLVPSTDTPAPPMRRTMYGTELECDTRFGDFGVEGVATGFWNPAKYK